MTINIPTPIFVDVNGLEDGYNLEGLFNTIPTPNPICNGSVVFDRIKTSEDPEWSSLDGALQRAYRAIMELTNLGPGDEFYWLFRW